jgi:shikimate dehydrogenase
MRMIYTLNDLRNWPEISRDVERAIRLGVFGDPVKHSLSPSMQNAALRHSGIGMAYARFRILPEELSDALALVRQNGFVGLNLTVPHKIAAVPLMDRCDEMVKQINAINTVRFDEGNALGFNTDGIGFSRALREVFSVDLRDLRVLVLGAGGAGQAIAFQCALENSERLVIANRDVEKARRIVEKLRSHFSGPRVLGPVARIEAVPLNDEALLFQIAHTDLLVNATTLGLGPADSSPISAHRLAPHLLVFDATYRTGKTPLVSAAEAAGARACDGHAMLLQQGAAAFEIWFNRVAPIEAMRAALDSSHSD